MKYNVCMIQEQGGITVAHFPLCDDAEREQALNAVREAMKLMNGTEEWRAAEIRVTAADRQLYLPECEKMELMVDSQEEPVAVVRTRGVDYEVPEYVVQVDANGDPLPGC